MNHRIFERILRSRPRLRACLPQRRVNCPIPPSSACMMADGDRSQSGSSQVQSAQVFIRCFLAWAHLFIHLRSTQAALEYSSCMSLESAGLGKELRSDLPLSGSPLFNNWKPNTSRPELRQDYPLNLSISISGGKETNQDSPSNGERTGKSPT